MTVTQLASLPCCYQTTFLFKSCSKRNNLILNMSINVPVARGGKKKLLQKLWCSFSLELYMWFCLTCSASVRCPSDRFKMSHDEPLISWELSPVKQKHLVSSPSPHQQSYMRCFQGHLNVRCIIQLCFFSVFPNDTTRLLWNRKMLIKLSSIENRSHLEERWLKKKEEWEWEWCCAREMRVTLGGGGICVCVKIGSRHFRRARMEG